MQPPADYGEIDESDNTATIAGAGGGGGARGGKRNPAPGRNLDPNGYVVDGSSAPGGGEYAIPKEDHGGSTYAEMMAPDDGGEGGGGGVDQSDV
jgi:hypothetical protein